MSTEGCAEAKKLGAKKVLYWSLEYQTSFESTDISVKERQLKIYFQDDSCNDRLRYLIGTIFSSFDSQIIQKILLIPVNWPFDSREVQARFARWQPSI